MSDESKQEAGMRQADALVKALEAAGVPPDYAVEVADDCVRTARSFLEAETFEAAKARLREMRAAAEAAE